MYWKATPAQKVKLHRHKHNLRKLSTKRRPLKWRRFTNEADFSTPWLILFLAYLATFLMEHAMNMVLVDPRVLEQLKDKESFEHEKLLEKKHSRPAERK